jgi:hypothetical protein
MTHIAFRVISVAFACITLGLAAPISGAQSVTPKYELSAFVGQWKINLEKTRMERFGPTAKNLPRTPTRTFIFKPDGQNLQHSIYAQYPQPKPDRTLIVAPDGKHHPCEDPVSCLSTGGQSKEQSFVYQQIDSHVMLRIFYVKGKIDEYSTYAVSTDGKTVTVITWSPETPHWQNIQVFDRQP